MESSIPIPIEPVQYPVAEATMEITSAILSEKSGMIMTQSSDFNRFKGHVTNGNPYYCVCQFQAAWECVFKGTFVRNLINFFFNLFVKTKRKTIFLE